MSASNAKPSGEIVPLADRLRYTQLFRLAVVAVVGVAIALSSDMLEVPRPLLLMTTGGYLTLTVLGFALWRFVRRQAVTLFGALLIVDGVFLAWVAQATGGSASPLRYLILLHLVAVALLASYRTGLKLAMWHSLLLWVGYQAQKSEVLPLSDAASGLAGSELDRLLVFAAMVWIATIATASFSSINERELRRRRFDSEALAAMARRLEQSEEPLEVSEVVLESVVDAFGFERGIVLNRGEDGSDTVVAMAHHGEVDLAAVDAPLPADAVLRRVLEGRRTVLLASSGADRDEWLTALLPGAANLVLVPLTAEGRSMGVLVVEHAMRSGSRIERRVVGAVERFAAHGALTLRNAGLLLALRRTADTDGLTGIANRRIFDETMARELARAVRSGEELSLVLLDIDHFKRLNDTHGHQVGDDVLRRVAQALADGTRTYDIAARYGGEEFAIVLPRTPHEDAGAVAERLRRCAVDAEGEPGVTLSAGVATFPRDASDVAGLIARADEALYASKRAGRDRLTVAGGGDGERAELVHG
jgi:diguanylate cyclase (GGDEF)-like protein